MSLNVLIISSRADLGGGPEHILTLLRHAKGVQFYVACPIEPPYWERFREVVGEHRMLAIPHRRFSVWALVKLINFANCKGIRVIHSHGKGAGVFSRLVAFMAGKPCVHTFHGLHTGDYGPLRRSLYLLFERVLGRLTKLTISVSKGEASLLTLARIGKALSLLIIENGISVSDRPIKRMFCSSPPKQVVSVVRFNYQKNPECILSIAQALLNVKALDRFHFCILGGGEGIERFRQLVVEEELEAHITVVGPVESCLPYFRNSAIYLSTARWEGLPIALLEAMAEGTPAVVSRVVGNEDLIKHGVNGLLYECGDAREAALLLLDLANNEGMWSSMSLKGQELVASRFSAELMASKTTECYARLTA